ncbi:unnamed protein product [Mytilus coruscus]|uniref:Uncharacterized protein n=1 Tax=Mytilus coruscus TaxID=42192 RepID=A0A6J8DWA8_MYTCO|nr:unnamed protein product [Mytilus coruscus]
MTVQKQGPKSIEDISFKLYMAINGTGKDIHGSSLIPDNKTVFTNHNSNSIRILKKDGSLDYDVKLWHYAYDVECIDIDTLVVTSGNSKSKCISIVDMKYNGVKRIPLDSDSYWIAGTDLDGDLIYSGGEKGIQRINLQDKLSGEIVLEENKSFCYVATFGNNINHTNSSENSVTSFDFNGEKQWTFNNATVLEFPVDISVDNNGNVFVAGRHSNNVIVISADGKQHREVLSSEDGLSNPWSLHYDRSTNQLLVANTSATAFIHHSI